MNHFETAETFCCSNLCTLLPHLHYLKTPQTNTPQNMVSFKTHSSLLLPAFLFLLSSTFSPSHGASQETGGEKFGELGTRRRSSLLEQKTHLAVEENSSFVLAADRTYRIDPLDDRKRYVGGWNISNEHYWASVGFTAAPLFLVASIWFIVFGVTLFFIGCCYCCCPREPYGYSKTAYALSLVFLILFTLAAIVGCVVLYIGQGKFHGSTSDTLGYVVKQADDTVDNLRNVSYYLSSAKKVGVDNVFLPSDVQTRIDQISMKISDSANDLSDQTGKNADRIQTVLDEIRVILIVIAAVMLTLAFLGFLFSLLGLKCLVYTLVIIGWILVAATFILCGVFLLFHNVVGDTCVAMDDWVKNPAEHTALDDILPCIDAATANQTLYETKEVTHELVSAVNTVITNVSNQNISPNFATVYYNQSGPLMPVLCDPFHNDMTDRQCSTGEVDLSNATQVWRNYICQVSSSGICTTVGRVTPDLYNQMSASVNVSYGLYQYGPYLAQLEDCTFVRETFTHIGDDYCPGLRQDSKWTYIGLVIVSTSVMLSLIFWVVYSRERRHRVYTKQFSPI